MLTVACVLRTGPEYKVEHVVALRDGVSQHLTIPHKFVCLTDIATEVEAAGISAIKLPQSWPGWWSKICLFCPDLLEPPVFYIDLDTIIVGSLDDMVHGHRFTVLRNFWSHLRIGSGLMAWDCDLSAIYHRFVQTDRVSMRNYRTKERWGDQGFIKINTPIQPELWQVKYPGRVVSYKRNFLERDGVPSAASIICYHGKPRPWQTALWHLSRS